MDGYRNGKVYVRQELAGMIRETDTGYEFEYSGDYLSSDHPLPVSITLPLQEAAYESATLFSFFDGLIPEGWLLDLVCHNWKLDPRDRFGLLLVACRDCIGDVVIIPDDGGDKA